MRPSWQITTSTLWSLHAKSWPSITTGTAASPAILPLATRSMGRERSAATTRPETPTCGAAMAAVQLDELLGQGQPEARALRLLVRRPHLAELLEDGRMILWRDADPGVGDGDLDQAVLPASLQADAASLRGELDRIG